MPRRLGHRRVLDGLRALAVMLVIGIHVGVLAAGYIGVDVFLPLSGFLITALLYEEWERTGSISLRRFYQRRVRRLLPALLLLVCAFAIVMIGLKPFSGQWPLGTLVATTLLLVNNWVTTLAPSHGSALGALSPTWSLAQEAQFYLLWPPVLWALIRLRVCPRRMMATLAVAIVAMLAIGSLAQHVFSGYNPYTSPFDRGAELLLGALAAIVWRERLVPAPLRSPIAGPILTAGFIFLLATGKPSVPQWYLTAAALGAMLIVNLLSDAERAAASGRLRRAVACPQRLIARGLAARPLVYTGRVSYGIYLFHVPIYYLLWTYAPVGSQYLYLPIVFALSLSAAGLSWKLLESPVLRSTWWPRAPALGAWAGLARAVRARRPRLRESAA
jgi:peptidoglycan/LPS O-acetylase OafA/YrhL